MVEWTKLLVDSTVRNTSFGTSDSPEDPEVKKVTVLATKSMEHSSLLERIAYFPSGIALNGQLQFASCSLKE